MVDPWRFRNNEGGQPAMSGERWMPQVRIVLDDADAAFAAVIAGVGIAWAPEWLARPFLRTRAVRNTDNFDARVAIFAALIGRLTIPRRAIYHNFVVTVNDWLARAVLPNVTELVEQSGLSRSQVERNCKRYLGAPPKLLARKYRALRAAVAIANHDVGLDDLLAKGFYDQSHFIREMKHFTGMTPRTFEKHPTALNQQIAKRIELERQNRCAAARLSSEPVGAERRRVGSYHSNTVRSALSPS